MQVGQVLKELGAGATGVRAHWAECPVVLQQQRGPGEGLAAGVAGSCVRVLVNGQVG